MVEENDREEDPFSPASLFEEHDNLILGKHAHSRAILDAANRERQAFAGSSRQHPVNDISLPGQNGALDLANVGSAESHHTHQRTSAAGAQYFYLPIEISAANRMDLAEWTGPQNGPMMPTASLADHLRAINAHVIPTHREIRERLMALVRRSNYFLEGHVGLQHQNLHTHRPRQSRDGQGRPGGLALEGLGQQATIRREIHTLLAYLEEVFPSVMPYLHAFVDLLREIDVSGQHLALDGLRALIAVLPALAVELPFLGVSVREPEQLPQARRVQVGRLTSRFFPSRHGFPIAAVDGKSPTAERGTRYKAIQDTSTSVASQSDTQWTNSSGSHDEVGAFSGSLQASFFATPGELSVPSFQGSIEPALHLTATEDPNVDSRVADDINTSQGQDVDCNVFESGSDTGSFVTARESIDADDGSETEEFV